MMVVRKGGTSNLEKVEAMGEVERQRRVVNDDGGKRAMEAGIEECEKERKRDRARLSIPSAEVYPSDTGANWIAGVHRWEL